MAYGYRIGRCTGVVAMIALCSKSPSMPPMALWISTNGRENPDYREFCVPPADLKARIISIHLMSLEEQHEAGRRMQHEVVPLVLTPSSDLDPATDARLSEMERVIDELERVIDLEAIFSNSKELGRLGCAGQELSRSGHDARRQSFRSSVC